MKPKSALQLIPIALAIFCLPLLTNAQPFKVLHFTETSGFDHNTRANSLSMFNSFPGLNVVNDLNGVSFDTLASLLNYDLIVFSNTSGSNILDSTQRANFESYIQNGGNLLGIHAASDTYRHSTANGSPSGGWDFYAETMGGSVQQSPNHVAGTPFYQMNHLSPHPSLDSIPNPWGKNEEYYYWENGYLDTNITMILEVEETIGPNNQVNSYDSARAVSWYKELGSGSRVFYTSMGHANSNYTGDTLFMRHIRQAAEWCLGLSTNIEEIARQSLNFEIYPNPAVDQLQVFTNGESGRLHIYTMEGKLVKAFKTDGKEESISVNDMDNGLYLIEWVSGQNRLSKKLIVK
jgi:type 1 glutamine amidotransferase